MHCAPVVHATTELLHSPFSPKRMAISPAAMFEIMVGMNKGFTRLAPFSCSLTDSDVKISMPPTPLPNMVAKRLASVPCGSTNPASVAPSAPSSATCAKPACFIASSAATTAYWTKRSQRRACFLVSPCSVPSKSVTVPATCTLTASAASVSSGLMPHSPATAASNKRSAPMPTGDTAPTPVITTLRGLMASISHPIGSGSDLLLKHAGRL